MLDLHITRDNTRIDALEDDQVIPPCKESKWFQSVTQSTYGTYCRHLNLKINNNKNWKSIFIEENNEDFAFIIEYSIALNWSINECVVHELKNALMQQGEANFSKRNMHYILNHLIILSNVEYALHIFGGRHEILA